MREWLIPTIVSLVAIIAFFLGRFSVHDSTVAGLQVEYPTTTEQTENNVVASEQPEHPFVASVHGARYYFIWCTNRITDKNKVYFKTRAEAEAAGYTPAQTCDDLW